MTDTGPASEELLNELRELFRTKRHSPFWRAANFAHIRTLRDRGEKVSAALAESLARFLREQDDLPPYQPATGDHYHDLAYALSNREVPEPFASWLAERILTYDMSAAFAELTMIDLAKLPKKPRRRHHEPTGIPASEVPDGYYAIGDATQTRGCYSVRTKDGRQVVRAINFETGRRVETRGDLTHKILAAIGADLNAAQRLFGAVAKRCTICGKPIEDGDNPGFPHGIGPDCWKKLQRDLAVALPLSTDLEVSNA